MKETFSSPHNPSESFAANSYQYDVGQEKTFDERNTERQDKEHILESEAAAYAAKPWMDVAVDLHDAKNTIHQEVLDEGETVYDIDSQGSLDYLTSYAERRAHQAAEGTHNNLLTDDETLMLDAFKAEAEMLKAETTVDITSLTSEQVDRAYELAREREKEARASGDSAEARRWGELKKRADEYNELIFGEMDYDDRKEADRKLRPDASNAGYLLEASEDGVVEASAGVSKATVAMDTANMRKTTHLYELLAEAQSTQPEVRTGVPVTVAQEMLKKQHEMVAAQEVAFTDAIDPYELEVANFTRAQKQIWKEMRVNEGNSEEVAKWKALNNSLKEYKDAALEGDVDELPDDITKLMRRRDLKEFLATVYPKSAEQSEAAQKTAQPEAKEQLDEYDPEDTILPTSEKGRTVRRRNFANQYFLEKTHQHFTPENVKLLQDYMVHELRGEIDYAKRHSGRVRGGQDTLFDSVFTLDQLEHESRAVNRFAYNLVKHNSDQPDLMYTQFEQMSMKDIAEAVGFDITKYIDDYDKNVASHTAKEVTSEKPYKTPPLR